MHKRFKPRRELQPVNPTKWKQCELDPLIPTMWTRLKKKLGPPYKSDTFRWRITLGLTILSAFFLASQVNENTDANVVAIRSQLYEAESNMNDAEKGDDKEVLSTIWAILPPEVRREKYAIELLRLITSDPRAIQAQHAGALYHAMFEAESFAATAAASASAPPPARTSSSPGVGESRMFSAGPTAHSTRNLRRLFLHTQSSFYHVHNAFDATKAGILKQGEWESWKGLLREAHGHPMLVTVIWQGYQNRYFSRNFAKFLQKELLCPPATSPSYLDVMTDIWTLPSFLWFTSPPNFADPQVFLRDCEFVAHFYPDMLKKTWPAAMPDY